MIYVAAERRCLMSGILTCRDAASRTGLMWRCKAHHIFKQRLAALCPHSPAIPPLPDSTLNCIESHQKTLVSLCSVLLSSRTTSNPKIPCPRRPLPEFSEKPVVWCKLGFQPGHDPEVTHRCLFTLTTDEVLVGGCCQLGTVTHPSRLPSVRESV